MKQKIFYKMPTGDEDIAVVIDAIPNTWHAVSGYLIAPKKLYDEGIIATNTTLAFGYARPSGMRFYCQASVGGETATPYEDLDNECYGLFRKRESAIPDLKGVLLQGKKFAAIRLDNTNNSITGLPFSNLRELLSSYVLQGYKGELVFYRTEVPGRKHATAHDSRERVVFDYARGWITLEWDEMYEGKKQNLEAILEKIQELGLKELNPV